MARELSQEERQRRRELALRLHAEGRFGGPQPGSGRPRKPRATEVVAEAARENAGKMIEALKAGLDSKNEGIRLAAVKQWIDIEAKEETLKQQEERAMEGLGKDKLVEQLVGTLGILIEKGIVTREALGLPVVEQAPKEIPQITEAQWEESEVVDGTA